uniref:Uncharacterized protein n=1 Tax=viral metagenome TaxID=1070528 RepID=A0A6M3IP27_9ZZZZ
MENEEKTQEQLDTEKAQQAAEVENRAKIQGWVPKEEFRGDQGKWIAADEFVKRADHMMPILKSVNKKLETQVSTLNQKLSETQGMVEKMVKINTKYIDDSYDTQVSQLKMQKRKAAEEQNWELYDKLEIQEAKLSKPEKLEVKTPAPQPQNQSILDDWMDKNKSWFNVDKEMTDYAVFVGEQLKNSQSPIALPGQEAAFCAEVERRIKTTFPSKFSNPNRQRSELDESGLRGGESFSNGKKGWNDLPDEARRQCNKLMAQIPGYKKENYIKEYFEGA